MTQEAPSPSPETETPAKYETADSPEYLNKVADIAATLGYEGPPNRSLYELAMRLSGGRPEVPVIREVVLTAHENGLISDQFSSNQLTVFRSIGDNSPERNRGEEHMVLNTPLWQRVVTEAEELDIVYGDPDTLWADISCLYGLTRDATFSSVIALEKQEVEWNYLNRGTLPANELKYTAPIWACHDNFSDEQLPPGSEYGRMTDW